MAANPLEPVYLITGSDRPKVALAVRRLRARFAEGSVELVTAEAVSGTDVVAATNALGLFGGGERLVVVEAIERWKRADVDEIVGYLGSPTPGSVLALLGDPTKLAGLAEACQKAGEVLRYDVPTRKKRGRAEPDYASWARAQFDRLGVRVDQEAAERLAEIVGSDTHALQSEIEKIVTWAAGSQITLVDIEALATPTAESSGWALANAWGTRDTAGALRACEAELRGTPEPFWLTGRLAAQVTRTVAVQRLLESGATMPEITKRLDLRFPPRREAAAASAYSADELQECVSRLAELDLAIKGGSRLDPVLELERALVELTEAPELRATRTVS